jgi:hypothetical protein
MGPLPVMDEVKAFLTMYDKDRPQPGRDFRFFEISTIKGPAKIAQQLGDLNANGLFLMLDYSLSTSL